VHKWLTPDDTPTETNCWRVYIPDGIEYEAAFRGAMLLLQEVWNWEKYGDATPEDVAELWFNANLLTFAMEECA
jgi:hypothetical protein